MFPIRSGKYSEARVDSSVVSVVQADRRAARRMTAESRDIFVCLDCDVRSGHCSIDFVECVPASGVGIIEGGEPSAEQVQGHPSEPELRIDRDLFLPVRAPDDQRMLPVRPQLYLTPIDDSELPFIPLVGFRHRQFVAGHREYLERVRRIPNLDRILISLQHGRAAGKQGYQHNGSNGDSNELMVHNSSDLTCLME